MAQCVTTAVVAGAYVLVPVDEAETCTTAVLLTPAEYTNLSAFNQTPTPADAGTAWAWGFSLVVFSYLAAWGCGAVLNFLRRS